MRISIHQPAYLPWGGYLEKVKNCDKFVYLDTVSFSKNSFDNRNRIPKEDGFSRWLTIPIKNSGRFGQTYLNCQPDNFIWQTSHLDIIKQTYKNTPYFQDFYPRLTDYYKRINSDMNLADINFILLEFFCEAEKIDFNKIVRASNLKGIKGKSSDLILNICKKLNATEYYSGRMGTDYLNLAEFDKAHIKVEFQTYEPPVTWSSIHQLFIKGAIL